MGKVEHSYSVAFTNQWSNVTMTVEASLMVNQRGVEFTIPWQMVRAQSQAAEGLYDVHLVIASENDLSRSDNRRTLTVGVAESELSSTSAGSFVPIAKSLPRR